jgi:hypothetical protein
MSNDIPSCPFCGGKPTYQSCNQKVSEINPSISASGVSAGIGIKLNNQKDHYFSCNGCNSEYVFSDIDINLIIKNFCNDRLEEIAGMVCHYYSNKVSLSDLILKYRTGIVRRHSNTIPYMSKKLARKILYICFNYNGKRTFGSFIRSKDKNCYTLKSLEVPKI